MSERIPGAGRIDQIDWNATRIAELTALWNEGLRTGEISRRMGIGRCALIGKAHRLGLPGRPNPIKRGRLPVRAPRTTPSNSGLRPGKASAAHRAPAKAAVATGPVASAGVSSQNSAPMPEGPLDGIGVLFGTARRDQCAWPLWDDATPRDDRRVCGCKVAPHEDGRLRAYCQAHAKVGVSRVPHWRPRTELPDAPGAFAKRFA
jgi:GcrA cell cycle regulator